jgi:hypothetical protein
VFGDLAQDRRLIGKLMQHAESTAHRGGRYLTDQGEHRCIRGVRRQQAGAGVQHAWPGNDHHAGRSTGRLRRTCREIRRALFVTAHDDVEVVACIEQHVEEVVVLNAG